MIKQFAHLAYELARLHTDGNDVEGRAIKGALTALIEAPRWGPFWAGGYRSRAREDVRLKLDLA